MFEMTKLSQWLQFEIIVIVSKENLSIVATILGLRLFVMRNFIMGVCYEAFMDSYETYIGNES